MNEKLVKVEIELSDQYFEMAKYLIARRGYDSLARFLEDIFSQFVERSKAAEREKIRIGADTTEWQSPVINSVICSAGARMADYAD